MSAETLREAARMMRERAEKAAFSPWQVDRRDDGRAWVLSARGDRLHLHGYPSTAEHIASWHPDVALAVADWLDHTAARVESKIGHGGNEAATWSHERDALAVARAYLGDAS